MHVEISRNYSLALLRSEEAGYIILRDIKQELGCQSCGIRDFKVLQFHHPDPSTKRRSTSAIYSWKNMLDEIAKCIVVCSNCHKRIEWGRRAGISALLQ